MYIAQVVVRYRLQIQAIKVSLPIVRQIDHTGDIGLVVTAHTLQQLFEHAARAMFEVIGELGNVQTQQRVELSVEADDLESLFVRWLSELNFRHITDELMFCQFHILSIADGQLHAEIQGEPIDANRHTIYTEVKAITYHHLRVEKVSEGWQAQFIFDM
ncbi:archease [candidate division KSB1 bacterium]|nr:archease [candidate division KSB1 bacterium]